MVQWRHTEMTFFLWAAAGASGAAALMYEIAWLQSLQLIIGSAAQSLAVLLATFMGGMALGALAFPGRIPPHHHPLAVFGWIEVAIGSFGVLSAAVFPLAERLYESWDGSGPGGMAARIAVAALILLPPTAAMGASLPVLARWVKYSRANTAQVGFIYAANVAGAVAGCTFSAFYLLRFRDIPTVTYTAAALNGAAAVLAFAIRWRSRTKAPAADEVGIGTSFHDPSQSAGLVWCATFAAGAAAFIAETVWTRLLGMLLGPTVYTFSIVLAVFLAAMSAGSAIGSVLGRAALPRRAFAWCQLLVPFAVAWAAAAMAWLLPYWPSPITESAQIRFAFDAARAAVALAPAGILWGASFTLALAAVAHTRRDPARAVGAAYAANAFGSVVGAVCGPLVLLPLTGTSGAHQSIMALAVIAGTIVLRPELSGRVADAAGATWRARAGVTASILAAAVLAFIAPGASGLVIAYGLESAAYAGAERDLIYVGEGTHASIAVSRASDGVLLYHNAGKVQASSLVVDMRLQRMLGHLTTLLTPRPESVLVIGCGAGATAGAVAIDPAVRRVTIVDIEPLVPRTAARYFSQINHDVLRSPKTRVVVDDARHFLGGTHETFDAITSDPLDPWVKGSGPLYTKEFFERVRRRLNPGGVATVFVQLYRTTPDAVRSELATFFEVFPDGAIWANTQEERGYDLVLVGRAGGTVLDLDDVRRRLSSQAYAPVVQSLADVEIPSLIALLEGYAGRASDLGEWLRDADINTDRNLRLEYLAGLGSGRYAADSLYSEILRHRRFPAGLFAGGDDLVALLRPTMRAPLPR